MNSTLLIQVLDYGSGNLFSISNALKRLSNLGVKLEVNISSSYKEGTVDGLILPGVGSFPSAQRILDENRQAILDDIRGKRVVVLGICLGMQLLFESSEEGEGSGLGVFKGRVVRFKSNFPKFKVPHMGWNTIDIVPSASKETSKLCMDFSGNEWAYFVHSFYAVAEEKSIVKAWTNYCGVSFASVVEKDNLFGTQFHPEKSHTTGVKVLSNFVKALEDFHLA